MNPRGLTLKANTLKVFVLFIVLASTNIAVGDESGYAVRFVGDVTRVDPYYLPELGLEYDTGNVEVSITSVIEGPTWLDGKVIVYMLSDSYAKFDDVRPGDFVEVYGVYPYVQRISGPYFVELRGPRHYLQEIEEESAIPEDEEEEDYWEDEEEEDYWEDEEDTCIGVISGYVYDAETEDEIYNAEVECVFGDSRCLHYDSNTDYFELGPCFCPSSTYKVKCKAEGYKATTKTIKTDRYGDAWVRIGLYPVIVEEDEEDINFASDFYTEASIIYELNNDNYFNSEFWINVGSANLYLLWPQLLWDELNAVENSLIGIMIKAKSTMIASAWSYFGGITIAITGLEKWKTANEAVDCSEVGVHFWGNYYDDLINNLNALVDNGYMIGVQSNLGDMREIENLLRLRFYLIAETLESLSNFNRHLYNNIKYIDTTKRGRSVEIYEIINPFIAELYYFLLADYFTTQDELNRISDEGVPSLELSKIQPCIFTKNTYLGLGKEHHCFGYLDENDVNIYTIEALEDTDFRLPYYPGIEYYYTFNIAIYNPRSNEYLPSHIIPNTPFYCISLEPGEYNLEISVVEGNTSAYHIRFDGNQFNIKPTESMVVTS